MPDLPPSLASSPDEARLSAALLAVRGAGAALSAVRGRASRGKEVGDQLKTAVDRAAEGWVLGYLEGAFPGDHFLAEERFEASGGEWSPPAEFWTVDALDGTRSFIDGFDGFCVQVAYLVNGAPVVSAIDEPAFGITWISAAGKGAFILREGEFQRVPARALNTYPVTPRFIDSTPPKGAVGAVLAKRNGQHIEHGSIGSKAVRIATNEADVFAKDLRFKLWDVAPADLILRETGGQIGTWDGAPIPYTGTQVALRGLLAAPTGLFDLVVSDLAATV